MEQSVTERLQAKSPAEAIIKQIGRFLDNVYMDKRIDSSLGYLTPAEFGAQCREEHVLALEFELKIA